MTRRPDPTKASIAARAEELKAKMGSILTHPTVRRWTSVTGFPKEGSALKRIQRTIQVEGATFCPINGGELAGWLTMMNDYPEGEQNDAATILLGFSIRGRVLLTPEGVIQ